MLSLEPARLRRKRRGLRRRVRRISIQRQKPVESQKTLQDLLKLGQLLVTGPDMLRQVCGRLRL